MAKEKHQGKRIFVVVEENNDSRVKLCFLDDQQTSGKETLGTFKNIENDSDFYYVVIKNLNSTNLRKPPEYKFLDSDNNEVKGIRCEGTADKVLKLEAIYTKDAGEISQKYRERLLESESAQ